MQGWLDDWMKIATRGVACVNVLRMYKLCIGVEKTENVTFARLWLFPITLVHWHVEKYSKHEFAFHCKILLVRWKPDPKLYWCVGNWIQNSTATLITEYKILLLHWKPDPKFYWYVENWIQIHVNMFVFIACTVCDDVSSDIGMHFKWMATILINPSHTNGGYCC